MTNAYFGNLQINHEAINDNKDYLSFLNQINDATFSYVDSDKMIHIALNNEEDEEIVIFDTDFEYRPLDSNDIKKYLKAEIDRLTMLKSFNPQIPKLTGLIKLEESFLGD